VVSEDFTMAAIAATISNSELEEQILADVDSIILANPGTATIFTGGLPYIRKAILHDVRRDGLLLIPLALVIMLLFLWFAFREWKGMVLPFTVVAMSIAVAMGMAPLLGWKLSVISLIVPIMLIAVANDYGIHMIAMYQEVLGKGESRSMPEVVKEVTRRLRKPIIFTGLTTVAGVLGLLTHSIIPARQVGAMTAVGVALAIILTLFMIPAWLSMLKPGNRRPLKPGSDRAGWLEKALVKASSVITRHPGRVLIISSALTLVFAIGISFVRVDSNNENFFPAKHPVKVASKLINSGFGGSQSISVMVEGDIKDPVLLKKLERWTNNINEIKGVGHVYSISEVIKEMSKGLYDPDEEGYNSIPATRDGVAQLLELYNMSGDPEDFEKLVDYDYSKAHMMIRLSNPENTIIKEVISKIENLAEKDGTEITVGGYAYIMAEFANRIVRGQVSSLVFALVVVFILLAIIFKSVKGGLISVLPIIASVIFLLGFMGISGISLNPATALLSSIMIGVGVDYTIHFIWRYKAELKNMSYNEAVQKTLINTGRGIVFNALSVMVGFSVLIFSGFTSIRFFGYLVLISIGVCLISALFVVPSLMIIFKPDFVEPGSIIKQKKQLEFFKVMKRAMMLMLIAFLPASGTLYPQSKPVQTDQEAIEIMNKSREAMKVSTFEAVSDLTITDDRGRVRERTNVTASKSYPDGTEKRIMKFLSPPEVEGTTMLIYDHDQGEDEMWIYLPALRKSRRIVSSEKGKSFMGSEFTNADIASPPTADFIHRILPGQDNKGYIRIESTPVNTDKEDEYGYSRKISTISLENFTVSNIEFYNFDGELYKKIEIPEYSEISPGRYLIKHMTAVNIINNHRSEIIMRDLSAGNEIRDDLFIVANLGR
jgi:hydrophobe/amphiphile efflux-3 (HAE3) family protein